MSIIRVCLICLLAALVVTVSVPRASAQVLRPRQLQPPPEDPYQPQRPGKPPLRIRPIQPREIERTPRIYQGPRSTGQSGSGQQSGAGQPAQAAQTYSVSFDAAYNFANQQGFTSSAVRGDATSNCEVWSNEPHGLRFRSGFNSVLGSRCNFVMFGGRQLNQGWTFVSYIMTDVLCRHKAGYRINRRPTPGSRNIRFDVHCWNEGSPVNSIGSVGCQLYFKTLVLQGPANAHWQDAFR